MPTPLEHDYIGLTESSSMERSSEKLSSSSSSTTTLSDEKSSPCNLKETELRLGLPGSQSPERKPGFGVSLFGKDLEEKLNGYSPNASKNVESGVKRGFSDAIDNGSSGKWVFSVCDGSENDLGKGGVFPSPGGGNGVKPRSVLETQKSCAPTPTMKEGAPKSVQEKKPQVSDHTSAPAAK